MMNKRGQGLSMNTVIIAILVLVVLVFVIIFYTGGFSNIGTKISDIFGSSTIGQDKVIAKQNCQNYCDQAMAETNPKSRITSPYCSKSFRIDFDSDNKADKAPDSAGEDIAGNYLNYYCSTNHVADELAADRIKGDQYSLGVSCPVSCQG